MKSKSKNDVIEYKKQHNLLLKLEKHCQKGFFDNLETKNNTLNRFGQLLSHIAPINIQRVMQILSLLKIIKCYLIIVKWQRFSKKLLFNIIFNQSLKTLTYLNSQKSRTSTFLTKLT